jgi:GH43 family beta-xylosidase
MVIHNSLNALGRDPYITKSRGIYYYCFTDVPKNRRIFIAASKTFSGLSQAKSVCVWEAPQTGDYSHNYWAPELHRFGERWYIYVAAGRSTPGGVYETQRMHVLASLSSDPTKGPYEYVSKIHDEHDTWAIDGTILSHKGKKYFIWSGWEGDRQHEQVLFIARMKNPTTLSGTGVVITRPDQVWEKQSLPYLPGGVNEGPQVVKRKGKVHLLYSASGSWTEHYCMGLLTLVGEDPLKPSSWEKQQEPVFKSSPNLFGPGHGCVVADSATRKSFLVYHAALNPNAGWETQVYAQPISWSKQQTPLFGMPRFE